MVSGSEHKHTNRLIHETSPYLLQHAHNPVDWYPWGEEALQKAREEDRPIFLSIGYSACHWCHVMERESFENEEIARVMNEYFINIKVDREERPDLDEIYMAAVQAMTGSGGWPMSVFLTPDLRPFYGGTYFPPSDMYGRPGFPTVLVSLARTYYEERQEVETASEKLSNYLRQVMAVPAGEGELEWEILDNAVDSLARHFEPRHGGFGAAPKFPHSMDIGLLLRHYRRTREAESLRMAEHTLKKMANGGLYDQIGGGFHRYSVDERWLVPHFEKMLYDNALLAKTYTEAWQLTGDPFYRKVVIETLNFILREMTSPEGGFYSTQDADSEGEEGKFYVWTREEIEQILGEDKARIVCRYYGVSREGNFEHGKSILHVETEADAVAKLLDIPAEELRRTILEANCKLFAARDPRIKPGRDEKILTDWNGLMISALAFAGNALGEPRYIEAAEKACAFLLDKLTREDRLLHTYKDGRAHTDGFLSDYSHLAAGLLDTYEATLQPRWLEEAVRLMRLAADRFWDEDEGAFYFTEAGRTDLLTRSRNAMDNAVPSGNSIAVLNLLRLAEMTGETEYRQRAVQSLMAFRRGLEEIPTAFSQLLIALDFHLSQPQEIVLAGHSKESLDAMKNFLFSKFLPSKVVLYSYPEVQEQLEALAPVAEGKRPTNGKPAAYVCRNFSCRQPASSVEELTSQVEGG